MVEAAGHLRAGQAQARPEPELVELVGPGQVSVRGVVHLSRRPRWRSIFETAHADAVYKHLAMCGGQMVMCAAPARVFAAASAEIYAAAPMGHVAPLL